MFHENRHIDLFTSTHAQRAHTRARFRATETPEPKNHTSCGGDFGFNNDNNKSMRSLAECDASARAECRHSTEHAHTFVSRDAARLRAAAAITEQAALLLPRHFLQTIRAFYFYSYLSWSKLDVPLSALCDERSEMRHKLHSRNMLTADDELKIPRPIVRARANNSLGFVLHACVCVR